MSIVISQRSFQGESDIRLMKDLASQTLPANLHVTNLPYRSNSGALDDSENTRLWFNDQEALVVFCVCWFDEGSRVGRVEPLGCHIGFRRFALGHVVLSEGLRRLQTRGALQTTWKPITIAGPPCACTNHLTSGSSRMYSCIESIMQRWSGDGNV
ncbi:MAG: hypothetical protein IT308_12455 [Anaerolineaceae bacterium]|nr:hypothetical protein [Anaerolineaceae bacterium]